MAEDAAQGADSLAITESGTHEEAVLVGADSLAITELGTMKKVC